jgi:hypothetical protein
MANSNPPVKAQALDLSASLYTAAGLITNPGTLTLKISKDFGNWGDASGTGATEEDSTYGQIKIALDATDTNADIVDVYLIDDTVGCIPFKVTIYTCSATRGLAGTALPNAAADAAGGLAISDAGGLDIDTKLGYLQAAITSTILGRIDAAITSRSSHSAADVATALGTGSGLTALATAAELAKVPKVITSGTAQAVGESTITLAASETFGNAAINGTVITILSAATGAGQCRVIADYVASTKVASIASAWNPALTGTVTYAILPTSELMAGGIATAVLNAPTAGIGAPVTNILDALYALTDYNGDGQFTADALEDAPTGGSSISVADILDHDVTAHTTASTVGKLLNDVLADTGELQTNQGDWATATGFELAGAAATAAGAVTVAGYAANQDPVTLLDDGATLTTCATATGFATDTEMAKVPKSDSNVTWNATALASINAEVDTALNTAIPGTPTSDSINERIATLDAAWNDGGRLDLILDTAAAVSPPSAATIADAVWDEVVTTGAHDTATFAGKQLLSANNGTAPTAAAISDAVWDEVLHSDHEVASSASVLLQGAGDPWSTIIPASYGVGTAGKMLGTTLSAQITALGALEITVQSPVASTGTITVYQGDDYVSAESTSITVTVAVTGAPDLTGAGVYLKLYEATWTATSCTSDGTDWTIVFEPTAEETAVLKAVNQRYELEAVLASGSVRTLASGLVELVKDIPSVTP